MHLDLILVDEGVARRADAPNTRLTITRDRVSRVECARHVLGWLVAEVRDLERSGEPIDHLRWLAEETARRSDVAPGPWPLLT